MSDPTPQQPEPQDVQANVRIVAPEDYSSVPFLYSNFVQTSFTEHELTMHFSDYMIPLRERPKAGDQIDVSARPLVSVCVVPALAQSLIDQLQAQLDTWKSNFGPDAVKQGDRQADDGGSDGA